MSKLSELLPAGAGAKSATFFNSNAALASGQTVYLKNNGEVAAASVNYTDFIGITDQAIPNGTSGKVIIQGGVNSKVSSLTIGSDYYVQSNGTLSTTVTTVPAGRALSTTSILLEG